MPGNHSIKLMLKDKVNYKASHLHKFIDEMCDFAKRQENDMKKAVCRAGDWRLHVDYSDLQKSEDDWMRMSTNARQTHIKRVFCLPLRSMDALSDNQTPKAIPPEKRKYRIISHEKGRITQYLSKTIR